jgi:hypothetical protein
MPHLMGVDTTAPDIPNVSRLARENWRARKIVKIGVVGSGAHFLLPAVRQGAIEVKRDPPES